MWWHTVTQGRGSEGKTGEWSGYLVLFTLPRNMVYPALISLMRTNLLPVVDWTDAPCRFKWTRPFRRKTKSGFCACAIAFQTQSKNVSSLFFYLISRDCTFAPSYRRHFIFCGLESVMMVIVTRIDDSFSRVLCILILSPHICDED